MTKEWCENKTKELVERTENAKKNLKEAIKNVPCKLPVTYLILCEKDIETGETIAIEGIRRFLKNNPEDYENWKKEYNIDQNLKDASSWKSYWGKPNYDRFEDVGPIHMTGNLLITDHCYIIKRNNKRDEWEYCDYGNRLDKLGINQFVTHDTIYGDWSCGLFDYDTKERVGEFCADAGLVSVFSLDEALRYNEEEVSKMINNAWHGAAVVKNFDGDVYIKIIEEKGSFKNFEGEMEDYTDYVVYVELIGIL